MLCKVIQYIRILLNTIVLQRTQLRLAQRILRSWRKNSSGTSRVQRTHVRKLLRRTPRMMVPVVIQCSLCLVGNTLEYVSQTRRTKFLKGRWQDLGQNVVYLDSQGPLMQVRLHDQIGSQRHLPVCSAILPSQEVCGLSLERLAVDIHVPPFLSEQCTFHIHKTNETNCNNMKKVKHTWIRWWSFCFCVGFE